MLAAPAGTFLRVVHLVWASSMKAKFAFAALLVACAVSITGCHGDPFASFDRRACAIQSGPGKFDPQHCPEGWTLYPAPGPTFKGTNIPSDYFYYSWVDRENTLGLGRDTPIINGTGSDSLIAFDPARKQFITLRVPYPMGFYTRSMDGRIDDPNGGWKGRGVWAGNNNRVIWHTEGGKSTTGFVAKFQVRPDPLAK